MNTRSEALLDERRLQAGRQTTLTSVTPLLRAGAPKPHEVRSTLDVLNRAAHASEISETYAESTAKDCLCTARRLDLLRAMIVLVFKNASAETVWEATEQILLPAIAGLCDGQRKTGNTIGTGIIGSDGRDWLRELDQEDGDPLTRIIEAIIQHCPQVLFGHPESHDD